MLERRGVVGGAAVTEEFHPGFRNSVAAYTVSLLNPKVIRDLDLARARPAHRRARDRELPAARRRALPEGRRRHARKAEVAKFSRARRRAARRLRSAARGDRRRAARARAARRRRTSSRAAGSRRCRSCSRPARIGQPAAPARHRAAARAARPVHQVGRRLSRRLVRERADQGGVRLRRHRRQLREPLHAGLGLRAAAPRASAR